MAVSYMKIENVKFEEKKREPVTTLVTSYSFLAAMYGSWSFPPFT